MRKRDIKAALRKARKLIAAGWAKGVFHRYEGASAERSCYCSLGAINKVVSGQASLSTTDYRYEPQAKAVYVALLGEPVGDYHIMFDEISKWNDDPDRTQDEVLARFDKAIAA